MADTYLLVPMQLDVMVMNKAAVTATPFLASGWYENLQAFIVRAAPFTANSRSRRGHYLHWTLPISAARRSQRRRQHGVSLVPIAG